MAEITVQTGAGSSAVTVSTGARGPAGAAGGLTAHKSTHATGGSDELTPADIGAATAAQGTDAREWTAATVDQAEAEAGVATTRRAWTAQRVKQAIAAWFGSPPTVDGAALVSTAAGVRSWTGASITLAPESVPGVSFDSGYIATSAGGYIYTGVNAPIDASAPITTNAGGFIYTSAGGFIYTAPTGYIDTGEGGSITTGTGHLTGPNTSGTIALIDPASGTQTFSGAQTFSGQVEMTNQAATNATSAMTRALGDARYLRRVVKHKAAETSRANDAALTADPDLFFPVAAGEVWEINLTVIVLGNASNIDCSANITTPSGDGYYSILRTRDGGVAGTAIAYGAGSVSVSTTRNGVFVISGTVIIGESGGNVEFRWGQASANATAVVVQKGSKLIATKVQ